MVANLATRHAQLILGLREIKRHRDAGGYADAQQPGLPEAAAALLLVMQYLGMDETAPENLGEPLHRLATALLDVTEGRQPAMLTIPRTPGRPPKGAAEANTMGIGARALDALVASGEEIDQAASRVARAIQATGAAGGKSVTAGTVRGWRERLSAVAAGFSTPDRVPEMALRRWKAPLPPEAGETPADHAAYLLRLLRTSPALRWV